MAGPARISFRTCVVAAVVRARRCACGIAPCVSELARAKGSSPRDGHYGSDRCFSGFIHAGEGATRPWY